MEEPSSRVRRREWEWGESKDRQRLSLTKQEDKRRVSVASGQKEPWCGLSESSGSGRRHGWTSDIRMVVNPSLVAGSNKRVFVVVVVVVVVVPQGFASRDGYTPPIRN